MGLGPEDIRRLAINQGLRVEKDIDDQGGHREGFEHQDFAAKVAGQALVKELTETDPAAEDWSRDDSNIFYMVQRGID